MTINGYSNADQTAALHASSSDPWFHFYWPLPGEIAFQSWYPYDDRNNPTVYAEASQSGTVQRHPLDKPVAPFTPAPAANVPAQPATGAPGAGGTLNTVTPAVNSPTNIPGGPIPTQVTTQSEPTTGGAVNVGVSLSALNWKGVAIAVLILWLLGRR